MRQCSCTVLLRGAGDGLRKRVLGLGEGDLDLGDADLDLGDEQRERLRDGLRSGGGDRDLGDDDLGLGDAVLDLTNGKRVGDGELKGLGLRCAPQSWWSQGVVGGPKAQERAREFEPFTIRTDSPRENRSQIQNRKMRARYLIELTPTTTRPQPP